MASIEEYRASQDAMEKLRARHVTDAFRAAAGDNFTPGQVDALVGDLDLARFIGPDGEVDQKRVTKLLTQLTGGSGGASRGGKSGSVKDVMAQRRADREAKAAR